MSHSRAGPPGCVRNYCPSWGCFISLSHSVCDTEGPFVGTATLLSPAGSSSWHRELSSSCSPSSLPALTPLEGRGRRGSFWFSL